MYLNKSDIAHTCQGGSNNQSSLVNKLATTNYKILDYETYNLRHHNLVEYLLTCNMFWTPEYLVN